MGELAKCSPRRPTTRQTICFSRTTAFPTNRGGRTGWGAPYLNILFEIPIPSLPQQISFNKPVQLPIQHRVRVPQLEPRAMVLHQPVRLQDVRANLTPPLDLLLLPR